LASFQAVRLAVIDLWNDLWMTLVCNVVWLLAMLLVIPGPPATVALFYYANCLAHGESADLSDFWGAFRRYWKVGWVWAIVNILVFFFLIGDYWLIGRENRTYLSSFLQVFYIMVIIGWSLTQLYTLPFLFEQNHPTLLQALRNGALMLSKNFGFSIGFGVGLLLALGAGTLFFLLSAAFGGMFVALASNHAVINRLAVTKG